MIRIKDVSFIIKDCNLVPNQESYLGTIQQRHFQALVWWEKHQQCHGLVIAAAAWTTSEIMSSVV